MSLIFIVSTLKFDLLKPAVDRDIPSFNTKEHSSTTLILYLSSLVFMLLQQDDYLLIHGQFTITLWWLHLLFFFLFAIEFCMLRIMNRNSGKYAVELYQICINSFYTVPCGLTKYVRMKLLINALDQTIHVRVRYIQRIFDTGQFLGLQD